MNRLDELDIVLRSKSGKIFASIPQLSLFAKGENVEEALAALDEKKKELAAELEEAGELDTLVIDDRPATLRHAAAANRLGDLGLFVIKTAIVAIAIIAALTVSGVIVASKVEGVVNDIKSVKIGGAPFWGRLEQDLDRMASADSDLPEAKKRKLLADIRTIVVKWRPFVVEFQSALAGQGNLTPAVSASPDK
jgi:hypothetical protein